MLLHATGQAPVYLSYCTNVHPGESVDQILGDLQEHAVPLKNRLAPKSPFALGLRLGDLAIQELTRRPEAFERFVGFLLRSGFVAYSFNIFPQGTFHAPVLKARVYEPEWTRDERRSYTLDAARILARILPPGEHFGSLSTLPLGFGLPTSSRQERTRLAAAQLAQAAADLAALEADTGTRIVLALEPEPACLLATTDETIAFFEGPLRNAVDSLVATPHQGGEELLRRHIGVCLDACHAAVEFEDPVYALERLLRAGIAVPKVQLSNALELPRPRENPEGVERLRSYVEPRFLHQVTAENDRGRLFRFVDLPDFLAWLASTQENVVTARCHFHVPIHRTPSFPLSTTQPGLVDLLSRIRLRSEVRHLEVETYTFDLLPEAEGHRGDLVTSLEQELVFARSRLDKNTPAS